MTSFLQAVFYAGGTDMKRTWRSHCPIAFALDIIGDKWSLLVLRDLFFKGKSRYSQFLEAEE